MEDFQEFYETYQGPVVRYLRSKGMSLHDAEDLAQEAFTYSFRKWNDYDPAKASRKTWLYMIVRSRWINYCRDRKVFLDVDDFTGVIPDGDELEQSVWLGELREALADALEKLPDLQKRAVILHYFGNEADREIADKLGITPGYARVLIHRGLTKLAGGLPEEFRRTAEL